jgi:hypothetical protein
MRNGLGEAFEGWRIEQDFYKTFFLYQLLHEYRVRD